MHFFIFAIFFGIATITSGMTDLYVAGTWRYRMTVTVETPEGIKTGSAVREISNAATSIDFFRFPEETNPPEVRGEAVVVDLGPRGILFAAISDMSDADVSHTFPIPAYPKGGGSTTPAGIRFYRSLKPGTSAPLDPTRFPGYPRLVTFKDMGDPKSVESVMAWDRSNHPYVLKQDRFEELFGKGVRLQGITIEITDDPVTWGVVDEHLTEDFWDSFRAWVKSMDIIERAKKIDIGLFSFKQGEPK